MATLRYESSMPQEGHGSEAPAIAPVPREGDEGEEGAAVSSDENRHAKKRENAVRDRTRQVNADRGRYRMRGLRCRAKTNKPWRPRPRVGELAQYAMTARVRSGTNFPALIRKKVDALNRLVPTTTTNVFTPTNALGLFKRCGKVEPQHICCCECVSKANAQFKVLSATQLRKLICILLQEGCVEVHPGPPKKDKGKERESGGVREATREPLSPELQKKLEAIRYKNSSWKAQIEADKKYVEQYFADCVSYDPNDDFQFEAFQLRVASEPLPNLPLQPLPLMPTTTTTMDVPVPKMTTLAEILPNKPISRSTQTPPPVAVSPSNDVCTSAGTAHHDETTCPVTTPVRKTFLVPLLEGAKKIPAAPPLQDTRPVFARHAVVQVHDEEVPRLTVLEELLKKVKRAPTHVTPLVPPNQQIGRISGRPLTGIHPTMAQVLAGMEAYGFEAVVEDIRYSVIEPKSDFRLITDKNMPYVNRPLEVGKAIVNVVVPDDSDNILVQLFRKAFYDAQLERCEILFLPSLVSAALRDVPNATNKESLISNMRARLSRYCSLPTPDDIALQAMVGSEYIAVGIGLKALNCSWALGSGACPRARWSARASGGWQVDFTARTEKSTPLDTVLQKSSGPRRLRNSWTLFLRCLFLPAALGAATTVGSILVPSPVMYLYQGTAMILHLCGMRSLAGWAAIYLSQILNCSTGSLFSFVVGASATLFLLLYRHLTSGSATLLTRKLVKRSSPTFGSRCTKSPPPRSKLATLILSLSWRIIQNLSTFAGLIPGPMLLKFILALLFTLLSGLCFHYLIS